MRLRNIMRWIISVVLACLLPVLAVAQMAPGLPAVKWSTFHAGTNSRQKTFSTRVLSTEGTWQKYWSELTGNSAASAPRGLEWAREELWVIALGERRTGGVCVTVRSVSFVDARNIEVQYVETAPPPGSITSQAITSPYVVIRVERNSGSPRFVRCDDFGGIGSGTVLLPGWGYEDPVRPIRWGLLDRGVYSNVTVERTFTLASRREYEQHAKNAFPGSEEMLELSRDVRWEDEMVVAIHAGPKNRQTNVEIDRVTVDHAGRITITWYESVPLDGSMRRCSPYLLMRLPRYTTTAPIIRRTYGRSN